MTIELLGALTWAPGFKGLLTVAIGVAILCGSVALILGTNSGARLGFLIALTGLFGWFVVMGIVWAAYGIGYKGPAPTWKLADTVQGTPADSRIVVAGSLPLPADLPDPVEVRDGSETLLEEFPTTAKNPTLGDLVTVDTELRDQINAETDPWKILESSNRYTGETQSVVAEALGPNGKGVFESASDYVVVQTFVTGGKTGRTDNSTLGRIWYKVTSALQFDNPPLYAAVQLQAVVPQETKPGQAPPLPVIDQDAPVYTVVLERDRGALRLPSISFTIFSGIVFAILVNMLHRRDKLAAAQRSAVVAAGA